jgi:NADH:ubiquinone oxidoreductase subunit 5 (subunit L)/multisubunit Na+/H+ antiporter MnhA subunit
LVTGLLLGAGVTAAYTLRVVWLVFYGEPRQAHEAHATPLAMQLPLGLLAFGAAVTWLLAGPFGALLAETLPAHALHTPATAKLFMEILTAPVTYVALLIIAAGLLAWWERARLVGLTRRLKWLTDAAVSGFGFERINQGIVSGTQQAAAQLQRTQTGQLNWNIVALVGALVVLLALLAFIV